MQRAAHEGARGTKINDEKIRGNIKTAVFHLVFFWMKEAKLMQSLPDGVAVA